MIMMKRLGNAADTSSKGCEFSPVRVVVHPIPGSQRLNLSTRMSHDQNCPYQHYRTTLVTLSEYIKVPELNE